MEKVICRRGVSNCLSIQHSCLQMSSAFSLLSLLQGPVIETGTPGTLMMNLLVTLQLSPNKYGLFFCEVFFITSAQFIPAELSSL